MKIAVIVPARSEALFDRNSSEVFGGGNIQMYQIAKELGTIKDIDCYTFIEDYQKIDFDEADKFRFIKTYKKNDPALVKFWKYHKALRRVRPDAIIQHGLTLFSSLLALYCRVFGIRFVYMFAHDIEVDARYQESGKKAPLFRWLLRFSSVLIAQNSYQKDQLLKCYGKESHIVRNGFYLKPPRESRCDHVLWVARHSSWKRPELFIQLARQNPRVRFKMICPTSRAPDYDGLVEDAGKVENLEFLKFVPYDQIDEHFEKAGIFVNTSDHEGFPQTFIQAAMNGLPVLSLNVDPDGVLTENDFGFCCDGDFDLLNERLKQLWADADLYRRMSQNAFRYAEEQHDIRRNVGHILDLARGSDVGESGGNRIKSAARHEN